MAICNKQHRYLQGFNELPEAQDNRNGGDDISVPLVLMKRD